MPAKRLLGLLPVAAVPLLNGCSLVLLGPNGFVARQQSDIMITTTTITALIIVPVLIAIAVIAWRYRAANRKVEYDENWDHSPQLELLVWAGPLLIIIAVGAISWIGTHQTDPYRPIDKVAEGKSIPADTETLKVDVVSLRWKWLFFYPQYGIATVNELAAPINVPIKFKLTSDAMMDSFFIPALAGQIYTMPGMQTMLHAAINKPGTYRGFSANYSGQGFTDMRFRFHGMSESDFKKWIAKARAGGDRLDREAYLRLRRPSRDDAIRYYAHFAPDLYQDILYRCAVPDHACMRDAMADAGRDDDGRNSRSTREKGNAHSRGRSLSAAPAKPAAAQAAATY